MSRPAHHVTVGLVVVCTSTGLQRVDSSHAFANPVTLASQNGRPDVDLMAGPAGYMTEGRQFQASFTTDNTCRHSGVCAPGDALTVMLRNQLPEETNLHFHGLRVRAMRPRRSILNLERKWFESIEQPTRD